MKDHEFFIYFSPFCSFKYQYSLKWLHSPLQETYPLGGKRPKEHELELTFDKFAPFFAALQEYQANSRKQAIKESRKLRKSEVKEILTISLNLNLA